MRRWIGWLFVVISLVLLVLALGHMAYRQFASPPIAPVPPAITQAGEPTSTVDSVDEVKPSSAIPSPTPITGQAPPPIATTAPEPEVQTEAPDPTVADLPELSGVPDHITVYCDGELLVSVDKIGASTAPVGAGWSPAPKTAEWWASPGSPLPGEVSPYASVVGGHVRYSGVPDVFWNLADARPGCEVAVSYDSGDVATFEVQSVPEPVDKRSFPHDPAYEHYWEPPEDGAWLTLVTCDISSPERENGHLDGNIAVRAKRTA